MLNRFITLKAEEKKKPKERRPYLASECRDLAEADRWRQQIMREIGRKVAEIQNEGLGEHRLRDLNDEINKLIREKSHWERRIVELGGPNYAKHSAKMTDLEGNIIDVPNPSGRGPGYRSCGGRDENACGGGVEEDEAIRKEARKGAKEVVSVGAGVGAEVLFEEEEDVVEEERREEREREDIERKEKEREFVVHVPLPDDKEIERMVLEKKKMELLSKVVWRGVLGLALSGIVVLAECCVLNPSRFSSIASNFLLEGSVLVYYHSGMVVVVFAYDYAGRPPPPTSSGAFIPPLVFLWS
ncbi:hypothetical protein D5086_030392 [Populus alba]